MTTWTILVCVYLLVAVAGVRPVARKLWREMGWWCDEWAVEKKHPCEKLDTLMLSHGRCGRNDPRRIGAKALGVVVSWPIFALGFAAYYLWQGVMLAITRGIGDNSTVDQARISEMEQELGIVGDHQHCKYLECTCPCHGQIDGQQELVPDPRTTTEVPF